MSSPVTDGARSPGELIARGTRSSVHAYGRGAVVKVPDASTDDRWITFEAEYAEALLPGCRIRFARIRV